MSKKPRTRSFTGACLPDEVDEKAVPPVLGAVLRVVLIVSAVELFFMSLLEYTLIFDGVSPLLIAPINAAILGLAVCIPIWFLVIRPFAQAYDNVVGAREKLALSDPLTGLDNRRAFVRDLAKVSSELARHGGHGAVILYDLDKFKPINDRYGHDIGDEVLLEVARRITRKTRREDFASRIGGDEFIVLCNRLHRDPEQAKVQAIRIAEKIAEEIRRPIRCGDLRFEIGVSVGFGLIGAEDSRDVDEIFAEVDLAMYRSKEEGLGRVKCVEERDKGHGVVPYPKSGTRSEIRKVS